MIQCSSVSIKKRIGLACRLWQHKLGVVWCQAVLDLRLPSLYYCRGATVLGIRFLNICVWGACISLPICRCRPGLIMGIIEENWTLSCHLKPCISETIWASAFIFPGHWLLSCWGHVTFGVPFCIGRYCAIISWFMRTLWMLSVLTCKWMRLTLNAWTWHLWINWHCGVTWICMIKYYVE